MINKYAKYIDYTNISSKICQNEVPSILTYFGTKPDVKLAYTLF